METVLPSILVMILMLFALLSGTFSFITAQTRIQDGQQDMQQRIDAQLRTSLEPVEAHVNAGGAEVEATFRNNGTTRLTDFGQWDVIVQYTDATPHARVLWMPYIAGGGLTVQEWSVSGLYMDAEISQAEVYEPGILNPGEEMVIRLRLPEPAEQDIPGMVTLSTPNGVTVPIFFTRPTETP